VLAVVAVLAYTGYDMEDAMILNRSSVDRGFAHGSLYKNEMVDLREGQGGGRGRPSTVVFAPEQGVPGQVRQEEGGELLR
jgi:DNA-directed RNA polymerase I subunit RPA2